MIEASQIATLTADPPPEDVPAIAPPCDERLEPAAASPDSVEDDLFEVDSDLDTPTGEELEISADHLRILPTIVVDPESTPVARTLGQLTNVLLDAGDCFTRTGQLVEIDHGRIRAILTPAELAGLLSEKAEFQFITTGRNGNVRGKYRPLPATYSSTWLNNAVERARLPEIKLFTRCPVFTDAWQLVQPGFDPESGIYYTGVAIKPQVGTSHLDTLLADFCFKEPADRTNFVAVLLTAILMPHFIGSKPAALFNGNQPGLGKSILAQIVSILRDGQPAETVTFNPNDEEFEKRLGAVVRRGATTIIIDNAKGRGRSARIESACLERSITDPVLSFRLLGQSAEIRSENSQVFCITANTPDVSRDLITRSVVINLFREGDPARRSFSIADPETYAERHRSELLGELLGMVERWKEAGMPLANVHTRFNKRGWGNIVGGILEFAGERAFLANAEEAAAVLDETRRDFTELVGLLMDQPQKPWTPSELVELCRGHRLLTADLGDGSPRSLATKLGTLAGRFVDERFSIEDGRQAVFRRSTDRKGNVYRVAVIGETPNLEGPSESLPNPEAAAEPMPNLDAPAGSAP